MQIKVKRLVKSETLKKKHTYPLVYEGHYKDRKCLLKEVDKYGKLFFITALKRSIEVAFLGLVLIARSLYS